MNKISVVFVGGFAETLSEVRGGQIFACTSLIQSSLANEVNWLPINTAADLDNPGSFIFRLSKAAKRISLFVKQIRKDHAEVALIFTASSFSLFEKGIMLLIAKFFRKKTILCPRSGFIMKDADRKWMVRTWLSLLVKKTDILLCQSLFWKKYYQTLAPKKNGDSFYIRENWIDVERYTGEDITEKEKASGNILQILFLGRIDRNKGIYDLIAAAEKLRNRNLQFQLVVGGVGPELENVKQLILEKEMGAYVSMLGQVKMEEKIKLLNSVNVFVLASYFEGYPNSLVEAMASGLPCVASSIGAVADIIKHGENGLLFQSGDVKELGKNIEFLLENENERIEIGNKARKTALLNNSVESAVLDMKSLMLSLVD